MINTPSFSSVSQFTVVAAGIVVVIAGLRAASDVLVPFMLALTMTLVCLPMVMWLTQRKVPAGLAIFLVISGFLISAALIGLIVGASVNRFLDDLPLYQQKLQAMIDPLQDWLQSKGIDPTGSQLRENFDPGVLFGFAGTALTSLGNAMTNILLIVLTAIFLLTESLILPQKFRSARENPDHALAAIDKVVRSTNHYMAIKAMLSVLTGGIIALWLWILGVDYPLLWGLIAFLLNFIPNFGSILAAIPAVLLALVQLGHVSALLTALGYIVVNMVVGNALEPRVMGRGLDLSALVVFLSLIVWGWVFGPVGMLLSVPLTIVLKIVLESFNETRWIAIILSSGREIAKTE